MSLDEELPKRSTPALMVMDVFYTDFNEINFYFEDESQENLYLVILKKIFPSIRIEKIFPLHGKKSVIQHMETNKETDSKKYIYIVDKDFDDLLQKKKSFPCLFYLDKFCIENYMIEEDALIELVIESHPKKNKEFIYDDLKLCVIFTTIKNTLSELFILFYLAQKFNIELQNCSSSPEQFCAKGKLWELDKHTIQTYKANLQSKIKSHLIDELIQAESLTTLFNKSPDQYISGKFLISMIIHYIKSKYTFGAATHYSLLYRLAKNCKMNSLAHLAEQVHSYISPCAQNLARGIDLKA